MGGFLGVEYLDPETLNYFIYPWLTWAGLLMLVTQGTVTFFIVLYAETANNEKPKNKQDKKNHARSNKKNPKWLFCRG